MSRVSRLGFIGPQLPTLTDQPPEVSGWLHEVKHDGYRTLLVIELGKVRAYSRNGHDWSDRYPGIIAAAVGLPCRAAILDGEVIVQDERGASDFEGLQLAIRFWPERLIFYAFDLLHLDGKDLRKRPLLERRAKLKMLIGANPTTPIQYSEEFIGNAAAFFAACRNHELEGIVSKRADAPYRSGRTKTWLKTKCFTESTFVIIGTDQDRRTGAARALLAHANGEGLSYVGAAFFALPGNEREALAARLEQISVDRCPVSSLRIKGARWVKPELAVRVRHLDSGFYIRHATVRGIVA